MRTFMLALITGLLALLLTVTAAQAQPLTDLERALILQELMRRSALQPAPPIQWLPPPAELFLPPGPLRGGDDMRATMTRLGVFLTNVKTGKETHMNRAAFTFLSLLIMLTSACTAQTVSQFRDPKTGLIVEECLRDPQGWGGIFADVSKGNEYADCKTRAESLGLERVK